MIKNLKLVLYLLIFTWWNSSCTSAKKVTEIQSAENSHQKSIPQKVKRNLPLRTTDSLAYLIENNRILKNHFVGFVLHDPTQQKKILSINGERPFTPASNMKLYTLYTALNMLPDTLEALAYSYKGDSVIIKGLGDPSFLDPYQNSDHEAYSFLKQTDKKIFLDVSNFKDKHFGAGWAWDDYFYYYQAEKSSLPIYANKLYLNKELNREPTIHPSTFLEHLHTISDSLMPLVQREEQGNKITFNNARDLQQELTLDIPFKYSDQLLAQLLSDTLSKPIEILDQVYQDSNFQIINGIPLDSVLETLMIVSDNFIAEQLLLMCSQKKLGYMNTTDIIALAKQNLFEEIQQNIKWVDGSGLSRYNLVTANANIWVLNKIFEQWGIEKIKLYFPTGTDADTLSSEFKSEQQWIFAKTGSLSNNFNISGFIITKSEKILMFSFMNNHYLGKKSELQQQMHAILSFVRDNY